MPRPSWNGLGIFVLRRLEFHVLVLPQIANLGNAEFGGAAWLHDNLRIMAQCDLEPHESLYGIASELSRQR